MTSAAAGVDTWSPAWYVDPMCDAAAEITTTFRRLAGRGQLLPELVHGHRIGWYRAQGLLYAEGHPEPEGLGDPDALPGALAALSDALWDHGLPVPSAASSGIAPVEVLDRWPEGVDGLWREAIGPEQVLLEGPKTSGFAGFRRLDSTVNVSTRSSPEGRVIMAGIAGIVRDMPRIKCRPFFSVDGRHVQTVELRGYSGARILGRAYDKGIESGVARAGELLRLEDQRRFVAGTRRGVEELTRGYVRSRFHHRFQDLWRATKGQAIVTHQAASGRLIRMFEEGEISYAGLRTALGELQLEHLDVDDPRSKTAIERSDRRARARRRELGIVLADGVLEEVEVNLHDVLTEAMDTAGWGGQG